MPYDRDFFETDLAASLGSARVVAPLLTRLLAIRSVVDVGCGRGAWLRALQEAGVSRVLGIDGAYVDPATLQIDPEHFRAMDLESAFEIPGTYDLALSLEVAEHLSPAGGTRLVSQLTRAAPVVLFSAAVPGQVGTRHVHLQWPEFWARQFAARGFVALDVVRPRIWRHPEVAWWYQQNVWLYARHDVAEQHPDLMSQIVATENVCAGWVHQFVAMNPPDLTTQSPWALLGAVPRAAFRALRRRIGR